MPADLSPRAAAIAEGTAEGTRRRIRPSQLIDGVLHYRCTNCDVWKPVDGFYRYSAKSSTCGIQSWCKPCQISGKPKRAHTPAEPSPPRPVSVVLRRTKVADPSPEELEQLKAEVRRGWVRIVIPNTAVKSVDNSAC